MQLEAVSGSDLGSVWGPAHRTLLQPGRQTILASKGLLGTAAPAPLTVILIVEVGMGLTGEPTVSRYNPGTLAGLPPLPLF